MVADVRHVSQTRRIEPLKKTKKNKLDFKISALFPGMRCASLSFRFSGLGNVEEDDIQLFSNPISFVFLFQSLSLSISVSFSFFFIPVYLSSCVSFLICQMVAR